VLIYIYARPLWLVIAIILVAPLIRGIIVIPKWLNNIFLCLFAAVILYKTLFRAVGDSREIILQPFYSFEMAKIEPEIYRAMIMNVFLFTPLGLFLPYVFNKKNIVLSVLSAMVLSICIETIQYIFILGMAEMDDVIFNTLGATLGSLSYLIFRMKNNVKCFIGFHKQKKNH